jgi:hypothetical protein
VKTAVSLFYFSVLLLLYVTTNINSFQIVVGYTKFNGCTHCNAEHHMQKELKEIPSKKERSSDRSHILCNDIPERNPIFQIRLTFACHINLQILRS